MAEDEYLSLLNSLRAQAAISSVSAIMRSRVTKFYKVRFESTPFRGEISFRHVGPDKAGLWEEPNRKVPSGLSLALIGSYRPESGREGSTSNPSCLG